MTQGEIDEFRNGYFKELEVELEKSYDYKPAVNEQSYFLKLRNIA